MSDAERRYESRVSLNGYALPRHVEGDPGYNAKVDATWLSVMHTVERGLREGRIEDVTIERGKFGPFVRWVRVAAMQEANG